MKFMKGLLFSLIVIVSLVSAKSHFISYADMCETSKMGTCENNRDEVRNLQKVLNADKNIDVDLKVDGIWGQQTHEAVVRFQKYYGITPTKGYVGPKTKRLLAKKAKHVKLSKVRWAKREGKRSKKCYTCYKEFKKHVNPKKSYAIFKDNKLLSKAKRKQSYIKVDISEQRLRFYVDGKIALDTPCTTGARHKFEPNTRIYRDKRTPIGTFRIKEKIADKRSTIFGDIYINGKRVYHGDRRKYKGSWKNAKFVGASLKHWMRLTSSGIGLHASKYVKRYPGTNGCIRLPYSVARTLFAKVNKGTKVKIVR
jgi:lipoprotein-anchoring transpeptidase ErfK/SrfK